MAELRIDAKWLEEMYIAGYKRGAREAISKVFLELYEDKIDSALNIEGVNLSDKDEDQ